MAQKQRNKVEEGSDALTWFETDDWSTKGILQEAKNCKIIDLEPETEEEFYWDSLSHTEEENETSLDHESESDEDVFWDSMSQPEEDNETDIPETGVDNKKYESKF